MRFFILYILDLLKNTNYLYWFDNLTNNQFYKAEINSFIRFYITLSLNRNYENISKREFL